LSGFFGCSAETSLERLCRDQTRVLTFSQIAAAPSLVNRSDYDPAKLYPAYNFSVPIDHFHNETKYEPHSNGKFPLRYWYDATYYKPGGPVIVLAGGETTGTDRLPYLQKGIVNQLARATHGLGVILEHRYYGTSFPVPDLSVENLRFLDTQQALADTAYFAKNIEFEGLDDEDLTSDDTAWIVYGGSYAGAFAVSLQLSPDPEPLTHAYRRFSGFYTQTSSGGQSAHQEFRQP
jgi:hypothetical protein